MPEISRPGVDRSEIKPIARQYTTHDLSKSETWRESAYKAALLGTPAVVTGFLDTVGTSLGLIDENQLSDTLKKVLPEFGDYYSRNKETIQTISDITGMFIPGMAAVKLIQSGAKVKSLLSGMKHGDRVIDAIFTSGKTADQLATQQLWPHVLGIAQTGSRLPTYDRQFNALKRGVLVTKIIDSVKETAAFEMGVLATMNNSETLYPSDWKLSDHILFGAGLGLLPVGAEYLFTQRAIRKVIQSMDVPAAEFLAQGSPRNANDIIYMPGARDLGITLDAVTMAASKAGEAIGSGIDDIGRKNLGKQTLELKSNIRNQIEKMGLDKVPVSELFTSLKMNNMQVNTVMNAIEQDATSILGTYTFENMPKTRKEIDDLLKKQKELTDEFKDKIAKANEKLSKMTDVSEKSKFIEKEILPNIEKQNILAGIRFNSLEPTGEQIPINLRKPRFYDPGNFGLQIKALPKSSDNATTTYILEGINDEIFSPTFHEKVGFTTDGFVILPKAVPATQSTGVVKGTQKVKVEVNVPTVEKIIERGQGPVVLRQNLKQKITLEEAKKIPEFQSQLLYDAGRIWDWRNGQLGKEAYDKVHPNVRKLISSWSASSTDAQRARIQEWVEKNTEEWQSIEETFMPFKKWLQERADAYDGTVLLFRGENSKIESRDIVSMTTNYSVAARFANPDVIAVRVPIDDIIMPIGGLNEWEVIVKGHQGRKWGNVISGSGKASEGVVTVKQQTNTQKQTVEIEVPVVGGAPAGPVNSFDELSYKARSAVWGLIKHAADRFKPGSNQKMFIAGGEHYTRLSYVRELIDRHGLDVVSKNIQFPKAWEGPDLLDRLDFAILRSKYESFSLLAQLMEEQSQGILKLNENQLLNNWDLAHLLNLPQNSNLHLSPVLGVFYSLRAQGVVDFSAAIKDMDHFRRLMQEHVFMPEVTTFINKGKDFAVHGNVLKVSDEMQPVLMARKNLNIDDYKTDRIVEQMAMQKAFVLQGLQKAKEEGADLVGLVSEEVLGSSAYQEAIQVDRLIEGTQRGKGIFSQQSYSNETNPTLAAATRIVADTDRIVEKWIGDLYEPFTQTFSRIRARNNQASLMRFNQFEQSYRFGWNLTGEVEEYMDGGKRYWRYVLANDQHNAKKWKQYFGDEMPQGKKLYLPSMIGNTKGSPVMLDDLSHETVQAISFLSRTAGQNSDYLARTMGRRGIRIKPIHLPPPNLSRENVAYLITPDGRPKTVVTGRTPQELEDALAKERQALLRENPHLEGQIAIKYAKDMEQYFDLQDEVFFDMINYADSYAQTGKATGATGQLRFETGTGRLDDMITAINNHFFSIGRRSRAAAFISEISQARMNHKMSGYPAQPEASIWSAYVNTIYGGQTINPKTWLGIAYKSVEELYDKALAAAHDKITKGINPESAQKLDDPNSRSFKKKDKEFYRLQKELGPHMPFSNTIEYIKGSFKQDAPPVMKEHMAALNYWTSTLTLRFMELGHPILNMVSLATTMPAVIRALNKLPDETHEQWIGRIGAYGSSITDKVAVFNPSRALVTTMHKYFNDKQFKEAMSRAAKAGYFRQDVAEMMRTITAPKEKYIESTIRAGIDRLSKLSDKSEEIARQFAFGTGYHIGKDGLKLKNEKDLFLFANDFANKVIGDYRPQNRPQLFQGALGMPLGLFQTFAWNYFQRLFSYVENHQWRALATQYFMQAAVFGGQSVPGFSQLVGFFAQGNDGISNPVDGLQNRFGPEFADLILYGTLSNVPKIFGTDGIALWNRGDANIQRIPGLWNIGDTAPAALARNVWGALRDTVNMLSEGNISPQRLMEIVGTYSINRPIKYLMELGAGYSIDRSGEVISNEVRSGIGIASRILGMRPMAESKTIETLNRIRATELQQANALADLRERTRSAIRGEEIDEEAVIDGIRKYIESGGTTSGFARWFRNQMIAATIKKSDRKLLDIFDNPEKGYDTIRLLHLMSPLRDDE